MKVSSALRFAALSAATAVLILGPVSVAYATTATSTFSVTATVQATCLISAGNLSFGTYTGVVANATSNISVTCTNGTPYDVLLNPGATTGATVTSRQMLNGAAVLNYSLFSDSGRSKNWGQTIGTDTVHQAGSGGAQSISVYGQIPANQYPAPGSYTDTVTATISY